MHPVREPRKIPVVLSQEEVARLIGCAGSLKNQTALSVAYGAGLRVSEVAALKVSDINSGRMALRIEQGKGRRTDSFGSFCCRHQSVNRLNPLAQRADGFANIEGQQ